MVYKKGRSHVNEYAAANRKLFIMNAEALESGC